MTAPKTGIGINVCPARAARPTPALSAQTKWNSFEILQKLISLGKSHVLVSYPLMTVTNAPAKVQLTLQQLVKP